MTYLLVRSDLVRAGDEFGALVREEEGIRPVARLVPDFVVPSAGCAVIILRQMNVNSTTGSQQNGGSAKNCMEGIQRLKGFKLGIAIIIGDKVHDRECLLAPWPDNVHVFPHADNAQTLFLSINRIAKQVHGTKLKSAKLWLEKERENISAHASDQRMAVIMSMLPVDRGEAQVLMDVCENIETLVHMSEAEITANTPLSSEAAIRITNFFKVNNKILH